MRRFGDADVRTLDLLAPFASIALDHAERLREEHENERRFREQAVTKDLVRQMLQRLARRGVASGGMMRDIGRDLATGGKGAIEERLRAFVAMGLGDMRLAGREGSRYRFEGSGLLERERVGAQASCHLPLGYLEAAVGAVEGVEALGTETTCQSMGAPRCTFVVAPRRKPT